jgi:hypothetical protein
MHYSIFDDLLEESIEFSDDSAVIFRNGVMTKIGRLPGDEAAGALFASADGSVVVGASADFDTLGLSVFVWTEATGMRDLLDILAEEVIELRGWELLWLDGLSADGHTLLGRAVNPRGRALSWLVILPEPATGALVAPGTALVSAYRRALALGTGPGAVNQRPASASAVPGSTSKIGSLTRFTAEAH